MITADSRSERPRRIPCIAWPCLVVVCALSVWFYAGGGGIAYTVDSLTYRDAAINILAGRPFMATNV